MAIDPNAFSSQLTNKLITPQERQANQLNALAQQQGVKSNAIKLQQQEQAQADDQAVRAAWQQSNGDHGAFLNNLKTSAPHLYMQYATQFAKNRFEQANQMIDATAQRVGALKALDPAMRAQAWPTVRQQLLQMGHNPAELPEQYPGDGWIDLTLNEGLSAKEQVAAQQKAIEAKETNRHNVATEQNTIRGQNITMRGQNMTDARSREANATANDLKTLKAKELQNTINTQNVAQQGAIQSMQTAIDSVDRLGAHPGLSAAVGASFSKALAPGLGPIPGTDRADFEAELDTLKAQTFLPQVKEMKGMGALSDAEGKKLTDAIGALNTSMSEKAFRDSLVRIRAGLEKGKRRAEMLQQMNSSPGATLNPQTQQPQVSNIHVNPQTGAKIGWDGSQWVKVQ